MKLTDTQLVLLSAASQREDRAVELPTNLKGGAAQKVIGKLLTEGLLEEIQANGSLPVWRRDENEGAVALRITKQGLGAIQVEDAPGAEPTDAVGEKHAGRTKTQARKKASAAKPDRKKNYRKVAAKKPARRPRVESKQATVIAMLSRAKAGPSSRAILGRCIRIGDPHADKHRCNRKLMLPSAENALSDAIAAGYVGGTHTGTRGLFKDPGLVGIAEPSPMPFTRPRYDWLFSVRRGIRPRT